jgi:hypothetical protein
MSTTTPDRGSQRLPTMPDDAGDRYASAIELRLLGTDEAGFVRRLAALDDAPALDGQVLVAIMGGQAVAALSLHDQRVVANPFIPTSEAVTLLRLRAAQLSSPARRALRFPRVRRARLGALRDRLRGRAGRARRERARPGTG